MPGLARGDTCLQGHGTLRLCHLERLLKAGGNLRVIVLQAYHQFTLDPVQFRVPKTFSADRRELECFLDHRQTLVVVSGLEMALRQQGQKIGLAQFRTRGTPLLDSLAHLPRTGTAVTGLGCHPAQQNRVPADPEFEPVFVGNRGRGRGPLAHQRDVAAKLVQPARKTQGQRMAEGMFESLGGFYRLVAVAYRGGRVALQPRNPAAVAKRGHPGIHHVVTKSLHPALIVRLRVQHPRHQGACLSQLSHVEKCRAQRAVANGQELPVPVQPCQFKQLVAQLLGPIEIGAHQVVAPQAVHRGQQQVLYAAAVTQLTRAAISTLDFGSTVAAQSGKRYAQLDVQGNLIAHVFGTLG